MSLLGLLGDSVHVYNNIFETTGGVPVVDWDGTGTDVLFQGNDYWSVKSPLAIEWNGSTYTSLKAWRTATGEEMLDGKPVGLHVPPGLEDAGGGGTIGNADQLVTLTAYTLRPTSRLANAGLDLADLGLTWDPYHFADDAFIDRFFDDTPADFYANALPPALSGAFSVGADQTAS